MTKMRRAIKDQQNRSYEKRKKRESIDREKRESAIITPGEDALSKALEREGIRHHRQVNVGHYVADFAIPKNGKVYVVEVEGRSHDSKTAYDEKRRERFEIEGIEVIRVSERDARTDPNGTAETIKKTIDYLEKKRQKK